MQKFVATYKAKRITSVAFPLLGAGLGKLDEDFVKYVLKEYLGQLDILIEVYTEYVPQSKKLIPLLDKLTGGLTYSEIKEIKEKLCFEYD